MKLANIGDEYTREAHPTRVGRCRISEDVIAELERLVVEYGAPAFLRADGGPEFIADALREWCPRFGISYTEAGSPWENAYVESFKGRARDELLNIEEFATLIEAQVIVELWRTEHHTYRPTAHSVGSRRAPRRTVSSRHATELTGV